MASDESGPASFPSCTIETSPSEPVLIEEVKDPRIASQAFEDHGGVLVGAAAVLQVLSFVPAALRRVIRPAACVKWGILFGIRRRSPRLFARVSCVSVVSSVAGVVLARAGSALLRPICGPANVMSSCIRPVVTIWVAQATKSLHPAAWRERQRARQYEQSLASSHAQSGSKGGCQQRVGHSTGRKTRGAETSPEGATAMPAQSYAAEMAVEYRDELTVLAQMLSDQGVKLPRGRSHPGQLMRFAMSNGILHARTPAARMAVLRDTVSHLKQHTKWYSEMNFLQPTELKKWHPYCRVAGLHDNTVVLELFIGALIQQRSFQECQKFPKAVVSLMELAVKKLMSDDGSKPSQVTTLLYVGDVTLVDSMKFLRIGTSMAVAMNKNYPGRLSKLYVVDLPVSALWFLQAVLRFIGPHTRRKVVSCSSKDDALPKPAAIVRPSSARRARASASPSPSPRPPPPHMGLPRLTPRLSGHRPDVADSVSSSPSRKPLEDPLNRKLSEPAASVSEQLRGRLRSMSQTASQHPRSCQLDAAFQDESAPGTSGQSEASSLQSHMRSASISLTMSASSSREGLASDPGECAERCVPSSRPAALMWRRLRSLRSLPRRMRQRYAGLSEGSRTRARALGSSVGCRQFESSGVTSHKLPIAACRTDDATGLQGLWLFVWDSVHEMLGGEDFTQGDAVLMILALSVLLLCLLMAPPCLWKAPVQW